MPRLKRSSSRSSLGKMTGYSGSFHVSVSDRFEYAHRLPNTSSRCKYVHGHSAHIKVWIAGIVGENGLVYDFNEVKKVVHEVIDPFDHACLVWSEDHSFRAFLARDKQRYIVLSAPPTAETICFEIAKGLKKWFRGDKISVEMEETDGNWARYQE